MIERQRTTIVQQTPGDRAHVVALNGTATAPREKVPAQRQRLRLRACGPSPEPLHQTRVAPFGFLGGVLSRPSPEAGGAERGWSSVGAPVRAR
jgi:hypothetical protein